MAKKEKPSSKPVRDPNKSRSWFQRNVRDYDARRKLAHTIRRHRKEYTGRFAYNLFRDFRELITFYGFDAKRFIKMRLPAKRRLNILDAGAGFAFLSADIKIAFRDRVFVTALGPARPREPTKKEIANNWKTSADKETLKSNLQRARDLLAAGQQNLKLVDESRIGMLENFRSKRKYDIIFDLYGPVAKSSFSHRVISKYFDLLEPHGVLVYISRHKPKREIEEGYGRKSEHAKKSGYYLRTRIHRKKGAPSIITITKMPMPKRKQAH